MQTMHDRSLDWMNRGHHHDAFLDAMARSRGRGFEICAHVILGLPGETHADMLATARELARLRVDAVKLHNLYAVRNTLLAEQVVRGEVTLIDRDTNTSARSSISWSCCRPTASSSASAAMPRPTTLSAPPGAWTNRPCAAVAAEFARRDTWQGRKSCEAESKA